MSHYQMFDGNSAAAEAMRLAGVEVVSLYPITPQSPIAEQLSSDIASGRLDAEYIRVESEHSAMSAAIGAALVGQRAGTATASVGLALMHEVLNVASGCRVPIVMPVVNRSLASPWSLWCDHQDSMAERDSGWIQLYCENVQDVLDTVLMAYRIAEDPDVLTPVMVCLDGFFLSHSMQKLAVPELEEARRFVGEYKVSNYVLDPKMPITIDNLIGSNEITEMKYQQAQGFKAAQRVMDQVFAEFEELFGRRHQRVEAYRIEDAEVAVVTLGSMSGTAKDVVDNLRSKGIKAGAVKVFSFRPFPAEMLRDTLKNVPNVAVIDRTTGFGAQGAPLWLEVFAALGGKASVGSYIAGLAGRDIPAATIERVITSMVEQGAPDEPVWIDCDTERAMQIREVL